MSIYKLNGHVDVSHPKLPKKMKRYQVLSFLLTVRLAASQTTFTCDDGCEINKGYVDDNDCDCSNCEDEAVFNCTACFGGCPSECGHYTHCTSNTYETSTYSYIGMIHIRDHQSLR